MENLEVKFGKHLTVISGQNSTGKSTILGLVGQIFEYKGKEKTKNNSKFAAKYSEIFRFCPTHDKNNIHEYEATLKDNDGQKVIKEAKSRFVSGEGKQGRFRIDVSDRYVAGEGAIDFPVIYLGLKRLFPLAQEREDSIRIKELRLTGTERTFYNKYAKDILILLDREITPQDIKSPNKEFLAMKTSKYSNLGNSAGQDNLGQILTAIMSFKELKDKLGENYKGGILLVDEVDATLYAGSQINLMKRLYKFSNDYNLQIIFTTHSLEILELLKEKGDWDTEINFFEVLDNKVKTTLNPSLLEIRDNILVQTKRHKKIEKLQVLCEDEVTEIWCKNLLNGTDMKKSLPKEDILHLRKWSSFLMGIKEMLVLRDYRERLFYQEAILQRKSSMDFLTLLMKMTITGIMKSILPNKYVSTTLSTYVLHSIRIGLKKSAATEVINILNYSTGGKKKIRTTFTNFKKNSKVLLIAY